jgi:Ca2+-binding EF-hand superfamily protein
MSAAQRRLAVHAEAEARRLEPLLLSADRLGAAFARWDVNGNGALSLAEIDKVAVEIFPKYDHKSALMRAYKPADADGDGCVGRAEFGKLLHYLIYFTDLWQTFDEIDADHDKRLDLGEFARASALVRPRVARLSLSAHLH